MRFLTKTVLLPNYEAVTVNPNDGGSRAALAYYAQNYYFNRHGKDVKSNQIEISFNTLDGEEYDGTLENPLTLATAYEEANSKTPTTIEESIDALINWMQSQDDLKSVTLFASGDIIAEHNDVTNWKLVIFKEGMENEWYKDHTDPFGTPIPEGALEFLYGVK